MSKEFTVESYRQKLVEWALVNEVKYITGDVYHLILLREPEVAEFMDKKGYPANVLADAIDEQLINSVASSGSSWVGNQYDIQGRESQSIKDFKEMIRLQKEAMDDPMLKVAQEEKDELFDKLDKISYLSSVIRFNDDNEKAVITAKTKARLKGRDNPTALEVFKQLNDRFITLKPNIYREIGLTGLIDPGEMDKKGFWDEADKPNTSLNSKKAAFNNEALDLVSLPGRKLTSFLQQNPDEAEYLQNLIKAAVNAALDERDGLNLRPTQKPNGP